MPDTLMESVMCLDNEGTFSSKITVEGAATGNELLGPRRALVARTS